MTNQKDLMTLFSNNEEVFILLQEIVFQIVIWIQWEEKKREVFKKYNTSETYPKAKSLNFGMDFSTKFIIPHLSKWEFNDFLK